MAGRKHTGNNRLMRDARMEAERRRSATPLDADPIEVLQEVLDGAVSDLRVAQERVDALSEDETFRDTPAIGPIPNEWIRLRDQYRAELERISNNLVRNGIAGRAVEIKAAEAALMVTAVQRAAVEAGISSRQVRLLGASLRRQMDGSPDLAATATDLGPMHELPAGDES